MKSTLRTIAAAAALLLCGGAATAAIETAEASFFAPGSNHTETLSVTTPDGATAMQFTMTLPEGFTLYNTTVTLTKTRATNHLYRLNKTGDRTYKCVIYSNSNTPFASGSGPLFSLRFKAGTDMERGDYPLEFTEMSTSDAAGAETPMADATVILPVRIRPTGITVTPTSAEIFVGDVFKFNGSVIPAEADQEITWQVGSSYTSVASIDETGLSRGLAPGTAMIYARCTQDQSKYTTMQLVVKPILPATVTLSQSALELRTGESYDLTATVLPENAADKTVSWSSSNGNCVSVSNGRITARNIGTATITATASANSEAKASCTVTVLPPLTRSLTMNRTTLALTMGETAALSVSVSPSNAQPNPTWTSSNPSVAYVDDSGNVTALNVGETTITATATDGSEKSATAQVTVTRPQGVSVSLDKTEVTLRIDETATVTASVVPATAAADFRWSSSNESVAAVAVNAGSTSAVITAKSTGTAVITATTTDGSNRSASLVVTVNPALATSVTLDKTSLSLAVGDVDRLVATVLPPTASAAVDWSSSAADIVSVDNQGNVRALALGSAVVTATVADGSGRSASCAVSVDRAYVTSIELDRTALSLTETSAAVRVNATVLPDYATNKTLEWTSADPAVATVDATGLVSPVGSGTTTIRVRATDGSGIEAELTVSVTAATATSISVTPPAISLNIMETATLVATIQPATASQNVDWTSANAEVATVDADGTVTAHAEGTAIIIATTADGTNLTATSTVIVRPAKVTSITLSPESVELAKGETCKIAAEVLPEYASNPVLQWISANPAIATVDGDGLVTACGNGQVTITAIATDGSGISATCHVTVLEEDAIEEVYIDNIGEAHVYDLMGRRVSKPVRGLYILNGKIVRLR